MRRILSVLGRRTRSFFIRVGELAGLCGAIARAAVSLPRLNWTILGKITINQIRFSGLQAIPLVAIVATLIGAVAIIQASSFLAGWADDWIGSVLVSIIIRELGPLVTAIILIGRSGTAMATELGSMRLNGEIESLAAYRIDPMAFVVLPRLVGAAVSTFILIVLFDLFGVLGGLGVSRMLADISFSILLKHVLAALTNTDLALSLVKGLLFGSVTATLSCYFGLKVKISPTELPQAVTKAVVAALIAVFLADSLLAAVFYL
jgi:phospholipid/cholesterol/gamma-HCH transport system permease protein